MFVYKLSLFKKYKISNPSLTVFLLIKYDFLDTTFFLV